MTFFDRSFVNSFCCACVWVYECHILNPAIRFRRKNFNNLFNFHSEIILTQKVNNSPLIFSFCNGRSCNLRFFDFCFRSYFGFEFWQFPPFCWHWMWENCSINKRFLYISVVGHCCCCCWHCWSSRLSCIHIYNSRFFWRVIICVHNIISFCSLYISFYWVNRVNFIVLLK